MKKVGKALVIIGLTAMVGSVAYMVYNDRHA